MANTRARRRDEQGTPTSQPVMHDPALCPCRKKSCPRYKDCDSCREHHAANGGLPYCERKGRRG